MIFAPWISYTYAFITTMRWWVLLLMDLRNSAVQKTTYAFNHFFSDVDHTQWSIPRQLCKFLTINCRKKSNDGEIFMVMIWWAFELTARYTKLKYLSKFEDRWICERGQQQQQLSYTQIHFVNIFLFARVEKRHIGIFHDEWRTKHKKNSLKCQKTRKYLKLLMKNEI